MPRSASTARALLAHLSVLPLGLLLAVPLALISTLLGGPAVHAEFDDTMYIVAHLYPALVLGACLAIASFVARRWGRFNAGLLAGWGFLLLHLLADALLARSIQGLPDPGPDTFVFLIPMSPSWSTPLPHRPVRHSSRS